MDSTTTRPQRVHSAGHYKLTEGLRLTLIYLVLGIASFIILIPIVWMLSTSIKPTQEVFAMPPIWLRLPPLWSNYSEALFGYKPGFDVFIRNTLIIEALALTGIVLTSAMAGYSFARLRWRGRNFWFVAVLATMMLPGAVTLVPTFIGWSRLGAVNTFAPLIIPAWFGGGAFNIFLFRQFFLTLPSELEDAAKIDGAGYFRIFLQIMLPLVKPAITVVAIFAFIGIWNDFMGPLIYLNSNQKFTVSIGLMLFRDNYITKWNLMMAATVISILPLVILFVAFQKNILQGANITAGLKG